MNNTPNYSRESADEEEVKLIPLLKLCLEQLRAHWGWFLLSAVVCLAAGWFYQQSQSRVFQRQAVMLIDDVEQSGSFGGRVSRRSGSLNALKELNGISVGDNLKNEMFILSSIRLLEDVVDDLGLQTDYTKKEALHTVALYKNTPVEVKFNDPARFPTAFELEKIDAHTLRLSNFVRKEDVAEQRIDVKLGQTVNTPSGRLTVVRTALFDSLKTGERLTVTHLPRKAAAASFQKKVTASEYDKESSLIVLGCNDINAQRAEDVLNAVFAAYKRDVVDNKNRVAKSTLDFIDERISLIGNELSAVENELAGYKRANSLVNFESDAQAFVSETNAARQAAIELETQLNVANFLAEYLSNHTNDKDLIPSLNLGGAEFNSLIGEYNRLMNERNRLADNVGTDQAAVREKDRILQQMRKSILASVRSYVSTVELRLRDARSNEARLSYRIAAAPKQEMQGLDIMRQQKLKETLYNYLLNKREEVMLQLAINEANVRMVEMPLGSSAPVAPKRSIILLVALIIGLTLPALWLWVRHMLDVTVSSRSDVEELTTIPLLGEVPHLEEGGDHPNISQMEADAPVVEAFRILRYSLSFMQQDAKVLATTSCTPGQGKSFVTMNMAVVLGTAGKRVLLVDTDIRKRTISHKIGRSAGLTGLLSNKDLALDEVILKNAVAEGVDFLPAGAMPPNPSELLMSKRFEEVIEAAKERYDFVLLDSTPMLQVADAGIVNRVADLTLYVIRVGVQEREFLPELEKMYQSRRFKHLCIVLNDVDAKSSRFAAYGYGYGMSGKRTARESRRIRLVNRLKGRKA